MIATVDHSGDVTEEQMKVILTLRSEKKSFGVISEMLFDMYGYTWPYYTISRWHKIWKKEEE